MTVPTVGGVAVADRGDHRARHHLLVGPDDGYGEISLERVSVPSGAPAWQAPYCDDDRLVVVLAGYARVGRDHDGFSVTLGPDEVVQIGGTLRYTVELVSAGAAGSLELLLVSRRPGTRC
ncbi:hypothetical protein [Pseudonocardia endophytica]|uniref:Quercetin dioxygenase-like cupin family protein n=1 Tax=Pseudonocardia endophytica TaxID=401976 RepID=A0A4R1HPT9_PSEEN|nr:hypothetical protein [Pseudonocardia endophytica]TCK24574.1 hypothetical protein EV378_0348 [Pseudonocardia endophytica]